MTSPVRAPRPTPRRAPQATPAVDRRAHLRVVPPPAARRRGRHTRTTLVAATALVFASLLASAVLHGLLASGQTHLDRLDTELQQERTDLAREQLELAHLRSPERIAEEAEQIGMHPADTEHWVSAGTGEETVVVRDDPSDTADAGDDTDPSTTDPSLADDPSADGELASGTAGGTSR